VWGLGLCMTLFSSINTMIRSSPACSRKKKLAKQGSETFNKALIQLLDVNKFMCSVNSNLKHNAEATATTKV